MSSLGEMHHIGITVRDLEASMAWYERMFGLKPEFVAHGSGPELAEAVGVPDVQLRFAFLRFGTCVVELLHYDNDRVETFDRSNADVGSTHMCIDVPDMQAACDDLRSKGVEFLSAPLHIDDGPLEGCFIAYFKDLNGVTIELLQGAGHRH